MSTGRLLRGLVNALLKAKVQHKIVHLECFQQAMITLRGMAEHRFSYESTPNKTFGTKKTDDAYFLGNKIGVRESVFCHSLTALLLLLRSKVPLILFNNV